MIYGLVNMLIGDVGIIKTCALSPDGEHVVIASDDRNLSIWNIKNGKLVTGLQVNGHPPSSLSVLPDGKRIVSVSNYWNDSENALKVIDLDTRKEQLSIAKCKSPLAVTNDGQIAICAMRSEDHPENPYELAIWNLNTGLLEYRVPTETDIFGEIYSIAITPDQRHFVYSYGVGEFQVYNSTRICSLKDGREVLRFGSFRSEVIAIMPDGHSVISQIDQESPKLSLWNFDTGEEILQFNDLDLYLTAKGQQDDQLKATIRAALMDNSLRNRGVHKDKISTLTVTPNAQYLITGSTEVGECIKI